MVKHSEWLKNKISQSHGRQVISEKQETSVLYYSGNPWRITMRFQYGEVKTIGRYPDKAQAIAHLGKFRRWLPDFEFYLTYSPVEPFPTVQTHQ